MDVRQVVPKDAIPSVDDPAFGPDYDGDPDDDVVVLDADPARAYPVRYLHYHEVVNDEVVLDGANGDARDDAAADDPTPVAVTWCPLCGSAVVYDRRVDALDGAAPTFGVSGKLADDDLVLYDRETGSEWKQSSGECIAGELTGARLYVLPAAMVPWRRFREDHPDGVVLQPPGGESEAAGAGDDPEPIDYDDEPYREYFEAGGFGLGAHRGTGGREWEREDLDPKAVVLGVEAGGEALGFPLPRVESAGGVAQATVGGEPVVVFATPGGVHAFADPGHGFAPVADEDGRFRADGTTWDGATGVADDGRELERLPARRLFAFAWQDDHGPEAFFEA